MGNPDLSRVPKVTVLGSCRVYDPFLALAETGKVELRNEGVYGYVHYAKESLQQLQVMNGEVSIPLALKPFITHKEIPQGASDSLETPRNDLGDTDLLVIEISSLKEIEFDGYYLQINRLREKFVGDSERLQQWWRWLYKEGVNETESDRPGRKRFLSEDMEQMDRDLVLSTNVTIQDQASMLADMEAITGYFDGPILWVPHFNTKTLEGGEIPQRKKLVRYLRAGAKTLDQPFFNPRRQIESYGLNEALQDMAHYTPEFVQELARKFDRLVTKLLPATEQPQPRSTAAR